MCLFRLLTILLFILFLQILLRLSDNRLVETVGIPVEDGKGSYRLTACVSSQVWKAFLVLVMAWWCPFIFSFICVLILVYYVVYMLFTYT